MTDHQPRTPVVRAPAHGGHRPAVEVQCGRAIPAFDTVDRMDSILDALVDDPQTRLVDPSSEIGLAAAMARVHQPELVDFLERAWREVPGERDELELIFADTFLHVGLETPRSSIGRRASEATQFGRFAFDTITGIGPGTWASVQGSVASALTSAALVADGENLAVALCRPPGHHATASVFGGGCYLNNAAITAQWLVDRGVGKVAVVDVDFHHGNGTQAIFYDRADVVYSSVHGDPSHWYPFFTGYEDETGEGKGRGANINVTLPPAADGELYARRLGEALEKVDAHAPDVVVVSLGFDTYGEDASGDAALTTADYVSVGRAIADLGAPVVALLEGGYCTPALGDNLAGWLAGARRSSPGTAREDGVA